MDEARQLLEEKYAGDASSAMHARDLARLEAGEPLAYVIGHQPFLGLSIWLDSKPLIPRPETEWWTNELLTLLSPSRQEKVPGERAQRDGASQSKFPAENYAVPKALSPDGPSISFLDLCAGSGAVGCAALARLPNARVSFAEIDPAHEATILKNIRANGLDEARARVVIGDLFSPLGSERFDVIAANPPYIPADRELDASVAEYEPPQALYAGTDGLEVIRRIVRELPEHLTLNGIAWIECDSEHAEDARGLCEAAGLKARVIPDQYGVPRVIAVSLP